MTYCWLWGRRIAIRDREDHPAEIEKYRSIIDEIAEQTDRRRVGQLIWDAINVGVTGWKNVKGDDGSPMEFTAANVFKMLAEAELLELVYQYPRAARPIAEDHYFFGSPSPSATA